MGCCESKRNTSDKTGTTQENIQNKQQEQITTNIPINISQAIDEEDISEESSNPFIELPTNASNFLSKLICSISVKTQGKEIIGTGFILGISIDLEYFKCLMTNGHVISKESVNNNN